MTGRPWGRDEGFIFEAASRTRQGRESSERKVFLGRQKENTRASLEKKFD